MSDYDDGPTPDYRENWVEEQAADLLRISLLDSIVKAGHAELTEDGFVAFTDSDEFVEGMFHGLMPWREVFTGEGRFSRRVYKDIRSEWRETGRVRFTQLD